MKLVGFNFQARERSNEGVESEKHDSAAASAGSSPPLVSFEVICILSGGFALDFPNIAAMM